MTAEQQKPFTGGAIRMRWRHATDKTVVFVVRDDKAVEVPVTPGSKVGDLIAITGAVKSGEKVVLKPARARAGAPVKVATK